MNRLPAPTRADDSSGRLATAGRAAAVASGVIAALVPLVVLNGGPTLFDGSTNSAGEILQLVTTAVLPIVGGVIPVVRVRQAMLVTAAVADGAWTVLTALTVFPFYLLALGLLLFALLAGRHARGALHGRVAIVGAILGLGTVAITFVAWRTPNFAGDCRLRPHEVFSTIEGGSGESTTQISCDHGRLTMTRPFP